MGEKKKRGRPISGVARCNQHKIRLNDEEETKLQRAMRSAGIDTSGEYLRLLILEDYENLFGKYEKHDKNDEL